MDTKWGGVEQLAPRLDCAKRDAFLHALGDHHVAGRLTVEELDRRVQAALAAETEDELAALTVDLVEQPDPVADEATSERVRFLDSAASRWAAISVTLGSGGILVSVAGPRTDVSEFAAGATTAMLGFGAHWWLTRRRD